MSTCVTRKQNGCLFIEPQFRWISGKISLATELSIKSVTGCHGKVHCTSLTSVYPDIMYNVDQQLFDYCTAKFSNNTQCCRPVVDVTHELPLCTEHARKAVSLRKLLFIKILSPPFFKIKHFFTCEEYFYYFHI